LEAPLCKLFKSRIYCFNDATAIHGARELLGEIAQERKIAVFFQCGGKNAVPIKNRWEEKTVYFSKTI